MIRERIAGPPSLLSGEEIEFEARHGFPATGVILCILATLVPPFIWGALLFFLMWRQKKNGRTWVTNRRVAYFDKPMFSGQFLVISVPLVKVTEAQRRPKGCLALLDQMLGVGDVHVFTEDSRFSQCAMNDVKAPGDLVKEIDKRAGASRHAGS